jgi:hypothetical protein
MKIATRGSASADQTDEIGVKDRYRQLAEP